MRAGPSQEEIRRFNLGALLRYVHVRGPTSRAELTANLGLNRSTIGALTADLAAAGLVREGLPRDHGRAGRPSLVVRPESQVYVFAFTIEADRFTPAEARYIGSGAAVSAMVRREDGLIRLAPHVGWVDEPLGETLAKVLGPDRPVTIRNGADLRALAEHTRGAAVGCDNVVYLHGDAGIGGGIIAGGRPVTGHGGYGGEVGHMVVNPGGKPCGCGAHGCWETEVGEVALLRAAGRDGYGRDLVTSVIEAAARGDATAQAAVRGVGDWLGFGVANLVNIFNPEMVIFGGALREVYLAAAAQVRSRLNRNGLPACREHVRLRTPVLGDDAALLGAAEVAFESLLEDPLEATG